MYKCSICGKDYDNVKDRAECEIRCIHAAEEESKRLAKQKAEDERVRFMNEIDAEFKAVREKMKIYNDKYGYTYVTDSKHNHSSLINLEEILNALWS